MEEADFKEGDEVSLETLKEKSLINPSGRERRLPLKFGNALILAFPETPLGQMALSKITQSPIDGCDKFSNLPEPIIHRIYSFLGTKDIACLSVLSRRFREALISNADFNFEVGFESNECSTKCTRFKTCLQNLLSMHNGLNINRLRLHWFCKNCIYSREGSFFNMWVQNATRCNVKELDMGVDVKKYATFSWLDCVFDCQSLKVLKLKLNKGRLDLPAMVFTSLEVLLLDSIKITGCYFGEWVSTYCTSVKSVILENVYRLNKLCFTSSSVEVLTISACKIKGIPYMRDSELSITSTSLKALTFSACHFIRNNCHLEIACSSLNSLTIHQCKFDSNCYLSITSSLENLIISDCEFEGDFYFGINSSSIKKLAFSNCYLQQVCHINVSAGNLQTLSIHLTFYHLPRDSSFRISAPNLQALNWKGSMVDYICLEDPMSLRDATIHMIYHPLIDHLLSLLHTVRYAKTLQVNLLIIEFLFKKDHTPIVFDNLEHLIVIAPHLWASHIPAIASFVKNSHNLKTLTVKPKYKSFIYCDPDIVHLLRSSLKYFDKEHEEPEHEEPQVLGHDVREVKMELR